MLGESVHTLKENAEALIVASKEIGLEVIADKTKFEGMLISLWTDQGGNKLRRPTPGFIQHTPHEARYTS